MKKIVLFLFLLSSGLYAQYKINGELNPPKNHQWINLYKIEGAKQIFIKSEKINNGKFSFQLPKDTKAGAYRVLYNTEKGFADFLFNKENVAFTFNPDKAEETIKFTDSEENKLFQEYIQIVSTQQYKTDSLQIAYLKNPQPSTKNLYQQQLKKIASLQKEYLAKSKDKMVYHFIKATNRYNSPTIATNPQDYLNTINTHFFDTIDFDDQVLYNSTFIVDRITDYVFYMNYSDDEQKQKELHESAVKTVLSKLKTDSYKQEIIEFLISQFITANQVDFADYLLNSYYKKLPKVNQSTDFINNYIETTKVVIGRVAPELTWKENGKEYKLSTLNEKPYAVLVFWSTGCSHCMREIPDLYTFSKNIKNTNIVAFAMEDNDVDWKTEKEKLVGWHHILGLQKWENPIARTYQIYSTPTYIVLGSNKKIIAKPDTIEELKQILNYLEQ